MFFSYKLSAISLYKIASPVLIHGFAMTKDMSHPFQSFLDEYALAIQHLALTVPESVKKEAEETLAKLCKDENATEEEIRQALIKTGLAEYPHRHAFKDVAGARSEAAEKRLILDHVDETVRTKIQPHLDAGVPVETLVRSDLFEKELTADQRYQVEDAILDAKDHVKEEMEKGVEVSGSEYQAALRKWEAVRDAVAKKIDELEALASKDAKWKEEIAEKVKSFREGFSVTEPDPEPETVEKEIEYWLGTFGEEL